MRRVRMGSVVLGCALVVTVSAEAMVTAGASPAAPAPPPRESTEQILDRLGGRPCADGSEFTCVALAVPLDHLTPSDPRTIDVVFAVRPATGDRLGAFVTVTGGPGYSGVSVADYYTSGYPEALGRRFDLVFFDQRGLALSGGITCPDAAAVYYRVDAQTRTPAEEQAFAGAARRFSDDCAAELGDGADLLPYLGTAHAAEDLEVLRTTLQDERLWLYGESYGTQLSQTYTAAHGQRVAALVLDGTVDLTLAGPAFYRRQAQAFADTLLATLRACDQDPACRSDLGGDAVAAYDRLAAELADGPQPFRFPLADGGSVRRSFTRSDLETVAAGQVYSEGDRMLLLRALAGAARSDLVPLARLLYPSLGLDPQTEQVIPDPTYSDAIFYGVECQDYSYFSGTAAERAAAYFRAGDDVENEVPRLASLFYGDLPCPFWRDASTDPARPAPLRAEGVPTLVLGATADPATPYGDGVEVFRDLADGYLVTQQDGPHVIFGRGNACPDDLVADFLVRDRRPERRRTRCPGYLVDDYVPAAPVDAASFATTEEALLSAETEISYLPEYYYWDGVEPTATGCGQGGTLGLTGDGAVYDFDLDRCAFSRGFAMSGRGRYDSNRDRFELHVRVGRPGGCRLDYVRTGTRTKVTGNCDGRAVNAEAVQEEVVPPRPDRTRSQPGSGSRAAGP